MKEINQLAITLKETKARLEEYKQKIDEYFESRQWIKDLKFELETVFDKFEQNIKWKLLATVPQNLSEVFESISNVGLNNMQVGCYKGYEIVFLSYSKNGKCSLISSSPKALFKYAKENNLNYTVHEDLTNLINGAKI